MKKIILDTDPGIDDAIAICYAIAHPQLDIVALTSIYGNVSSKLAAQNALRLCHLTNSTIPVACGAEVPLKITPHPHADFVHGANGFGNIELPLDNRQITTQSAAELIVDQLKKHPGEITIVAVGPLTNLALALQLAPEITDLVDEVIVMGGVFYRSGNVTPFAEANIWNDPHAAQMVLSADWPLTIHGLDVTYQISFDRNFFSQLRSVNPIVGDFLSNAADFYIKFYEQHHNFSGCCPHDLLALVYATNPDWFECEQALINVSVDGEEIGRTANILDDKSSQGQTNKKVSLKVNAPALLEDYLHTLSE